MDAGHPTDGAGAAAEARGAAANVLHDRTGEPVELRIVPLSDRASLNDCSWTRDHAGWLPPPSIESKVDERIIDDLEQRIAAYAPRVIRPPTEWDLFEEVVDDLDRPHRPWILRSFVREEVELEPLWTYYELVQSLARPLDALPAKHDAWVRPPELLAHWSVKAIADYRRSREEWIWCDAAAQRRKPSRDKEVFLHQRDLEEREKARLFKAIEAEVLSRLAEDNLLPEGLADDEPPAGGKR